MLPVHASTFSRRLRRTEQQNDNLTDKEPAQRRSSRPISYQRQAAFRSIRYGKRQRNTPVHHNGTISQLTDESHQDTARERPTRYITIAPALTIAVIDAETRHILPKDSKLDPEFQHRTAPWEQTSSPADTQDTGGFTARGPRSQGLPEESRPYEMAGARLDNHITKEDERHVAATMKFDQLVRHGLIVGDRDDLRPLLAMPIVSRSKQVRREQTAQRLVDKYIYESSEDETPAQGLARDQRRVPRKGGLMKLKQALAKLEWPPVSSQTKRLTAQDSRDGMETPGTGVDTERENDRRPTLGFRRAMRNPNHPDFRMSFTAALDLAMAKEKKAHVLAVPIDSWESDGLEHASLARPRPQTRRQPFPSTEIGVQRKHDIVEYAVAEASQTGGLDFRDARLVGIFSGIMQRDNPRRPIRT
jgi:hypothetical protein